MVIRPPMISAASTAAWLASAYCITRHTRSRSSWSAKAPAIGVQTIAGNMSAKAIAPSQAPEWVSSHASQPTATRWIQVPRSEGMLDRVNRRKCGLPKASANPSSLNIDLIGKGGAEIAALATAKCPGAEALCYCSGLLFGAVRSKEGHR